MSQTRKAAKSVGVVWLYLAVLAVLGGLIGCTLIRAKTEFQAIGEATTLRGVVTSSSAEPKTIIVAVLREQEGRKVLLQYFVHHGPGSFEFLVRAKTVFIFAFEDSNDDLRYQRLEPAAW